MLGPCIQRYRNGLQGSEGTVRGSSMNTCRLEEILVRALYTNNIYGGFSDTNKTTLQRSSGNSGGVTTGLYSAVPKALQERFQRSLQLSRVLS